MGFRKSINFDKVEGFDKALRTNKIKGYQHMFDPEDDPEYNCEDCEDEDDD